MVIIRPANGSFDGYGSSEQAEDDITRGVQNLNPFRNSQDATTSDYNPFSNPFRTPANSRSGSHTSRSLGRTDTPASHPGYGSSSPSYGGSSGFLDPSQANPLQNSDRRSRRSQTPAVPSRSDRGTPSTRRPSSAQPRQQQPPSRPRTSLGHSLSRSSEQSSVLPTKGESGIE
jgi:hypothetical protein